MLEAERQYYRENKEEWLKKYTGRIVLIKENALVGVFNTDKEAMTEGAIRFGFEPFLVRKLEEQEQKVVIPALTLGLLDGNSQHPV